MSADNYGICPQCHKEETKSVYGKVSEAEYLKRMQESTTLGIGETLREDYEIRTGKDGTFKVSYYCQCSKCGFAFQYVHEQVIYPAS